MYVIQHEIMSVSYAGHMQEQKVTMLINTIIGARESIKNRHVKGIVLSLKSAMYDGKSLQFLIQKLETIPKTLNVPVALTDYSGRTYEALKALTQNSSVKLFKSAQAARLFFAPKTLKKDLNILIYDEDESNMDKISMLLVRQGYTVHRAKDESDFKRRMEEDYDIAITQCRLNTSTNKPATSALPLSKILVTNLPVFMDTAVETLVAYTGMEAKKTSHQIKPFGTKLEGDVITAVMHFKGDIQGHFVLLFPRPLAICALEAMLGEKVAMNDNEAIMDGVGELCNIITGSAKTKLSKNTIKVLFDLPKTYTSVQSMIAIVGQENGIWIDMQLDGNPFYMFISK